MTNTQPLKMPDAQDKELSDTDFDKQLPKPVGYRLLIALPDIEESYEGSNLIKTSDAMRKEYIMSIMGVVLDMGDGAYADKDRFPEGPWCKEGDWVCIGRYAGSRFQIEGGEVRIINDDEVIATIVDPDDIKTYGAA